MFDIKNNDFQRKLYNTSRFPTFSLSYLVHSVISLQFIQPFFPSLPYQ